MFRSLVSCGAALALATSLAATAPSASAQQADPFEAARARFNGQWKINRAQSADPSDTLPAAGGRRPGIGLGSGGISGIGVVGGGMPVGGAGYGVSSTKTLQMRAVVREMNQPPALLNVVVRPQEVSITTDEGTVRSYRTTGKKEKIDLTTADVDTTTKWDRDTLSQEMKAGDLKAGRTWHVSPDGSQLTVTVTLDAGAKEREPEVKKFVYDRVR